MINVVPLSLLKSFDLVQVPVNATFAGESPRRAAQRYNRRSHRNLPVVSYGRASAKVRGRGEQHYLPEGIGPRAIHHSVAQGTRALSPWNASYWPRQA
jgi:hypothetical protein